jgi:hypothetical protein
MSERGALLFRISANDTVNRVWLALGATFAVVVLIESWREHAPPKWPWLVLASNSMVVFFLQRRASIYENGIQLPANSSGSRGRFIAWSQVERFHWDGDVLTIVPTSSVMAGADLERPLIGGTVRIPASRRAQIENHLAGGIQAPT